MRPSGRAPDQMRELKFEPGFTKHAEGSCLVSLGETRVLVTAMAEDDVLIAVLDAGAEEVNDLDESIELVSEASDVVAVRSALQDSEIDYDSAEVQFVASMDIPVDADAVAREAGLPGRTNTVLQACFFAISGVLPREEALERVKATIRKTYGRRGQEVVRRNETAVDSAAAAMAEIPVPAAAGSGTKCASPESRYYRSITNPSLAAWYLQYSAIISTISWGWHR